MLDEALEGDCLFCVGRLLKEETTNFKDCAAEIGTAGLIRASREQSDGRSDLILHGVCRVRFVEWIPEKPYPFARIEPLVSRPLGEQEAIREGQRLREAVESVLLGFPDDVVAQVQALLDRATEPTIMCDAVAQQFVHDTNLRQELLEEPEVAKRIEVIINHLHSLRRGEN